MFLCPSNSSSVPVLSDPRDRELRKILAGLWEKMTNSYIAQHRRQIPRQPATRDENPNDTMP
jgi:hypothetical protein